MSQVFGLFAPVCRCWKTSGCRLPLPLSPSPLPGVCLWRVRVTVCLCVACAVAAAAAAAFFLCLPSASAAEPDQHTSLAFSLSLFSQCLPISTHQNLFFSFFLMGSAHTYRTMESGGDMGQSVVVTLEY